LDILIILLVSEGVDPFKRIYNRIVDEKDNFEDEFRRIQSPVQSRPISVYTSFKRHFGFNTSAVGKFFRDTLYGEILMSAVRTGGHVVRDRELINELLTLVVKDGRVDHAGDSHDDLVIAWLLTHWFLIKSQNLSYYGIPPASVLSKARFIGDDISEAAIRKMEKQATMKEAFDTLFEQLK